MDYTKTIFKTTTFLLASFIMLGRSLIGASDPTYHDPAKFNQLGQEAQDKAQEQLKEAQKDKKSKKAKIQISSEDSLLLKDIDTSLPKEQTEARRSKEFFLKGIEAYKAENYAKARTDFQAALDIDPMNSQLYLLLGRTLFFLNDMQGAVRAFDSALAINPDLLAAYLERGRAYLAMEANVKAKQDFDYLLTHAKEVLPPPLVKELKNASAALAPERKHQFTIILSASGTLDSDVTAGNSSPILNQTLVDLGGPAGVGQYAAPTGRCDKVFNSSAVISHMYPLAYEGLTWKNLFLATEGSDARVKSNNLILMLYSTSLVQKIQKHTLDYNVAVTRLEIAKSLSQINQALGLKYSYQLNKDLALRAAVTWTHRRHYLPKGGTDSYANNRGLLMNYELGGSYIYKKDNIWDLGCSVSHDIKPGSINVPTSYTSFLSYQAALNYTYKWSAQLSLKAGMISKRDVYSSFDQILTLLKRRDNSITGKVGVSYLIPFKDRILKSMTLDLNASIKRNSSNNPLNQYVSKQLAVGVTTIF